jgi:hypothetical protein
MQGQSVTEKFDGIKVFSATKFVERYALTPSGHAAISELERRRPER